MQNRILIESAQNGDAETLKTMLEHKADINYCHSPSGFTALTWAARRGHTKVVEVLLQFEIDKEQIQEALRWSAAFDHIDIANRLIDHGADIDKENEFGNTALNRAAFNGRINMIRTLFNRGANIDYKNIYGTTALIVASRKNQVDAVRELLDLGANIDHQNEDGDTALIFAAHDGSIDVVRELLKQGVAIHLENEREKNAVKIAYASDHKNIAIEIKNEIEKRKQIKREIEISFAGTPLSHLTFFEKINPFRKKVSDHYLPKEIINMIGDYINPSTSTKSPNKP